MWWSVSGCFVCFSASSKQKNSQMIFFFFTYSSIHALFIVKTTTVWFCSWKFYYRSLSGPVWLNLWKLPASTHTAAAWKTAQSTKTLWPASRVSSPVSSPFWLNPLSSTGVFWRRRGHRCPDVSPQQDYEQTPQQRRVNGNTRARSLTKSNSNRSSHVVKQVHDYAPYAHIPCAHRQMCDSDVCVLVLTVQTQTQLCHEHLL